MDLQAIRRLYTENGYVLIPGIFDNAAFDPLRQVLAATVDGVARQLAAEGKAQELYADAPLSRRLAELYRNSEKKSMGWNREVFSKAVYDLVTYPVLLDIVEALIGPEVTVNGDYWVRTKLPNEQITTLPWHQDTGYYGSQTAPAHILSVWTPLVDVDEQNGCMQFIPGSHQWGYLPVVRRGNHLTPDLDVEARGTIETLRMKAGDIVAFHNLALHRSLINSSDAIRWSIDLRYSPTGTNTDWLTKMGLLGFVARSRQAPASVEGWESWRVRRESFAG